METKCTQPCGSCSNGIMTFEFRKICKETIEGWWCDKCEEGILTGEKARKIWKTKKVVS